jgi:hypothetical protein
MVAYSFRGRFVDAIRAGISSVSLSFDPPPKRQTIRAIGRKRHARPGETLQLYHGQRTRNCFKIGEGRCVSVEEIRLYIHAEWIELRGVLLKGSIALDKFAVLDGFADWSDMRAFWLEEHEGKQLGPFVGLLIKWEGM